MVQGIKGEQLIHPHDIDGSCYAESCGKGFRGPSQYYKIT
jgi:hypothetical protein